MRASAASTGHDDATRRRGAVRTAWVVGGIALAVYAGFVLMGVLGGQ